MNGTERQERKGRRQMALSQVNNRSVNRERELEPSQAEASSSPGTGGILRASLVQQAGANLTTAGGRREKGA